MSYIQLLNESSAIPNASGLFIINEETANAVEFKPISESKADGYVTAETQLQKGNVLNRNRRFYPTPDLNKGLQDPRILEMIQTGNLKGEAGHPLDTSLARQQSIFPTLEQVWYKKLWMEGDIVKAWVRGTNNSLGESFNKDLKCGQRPSFSLRAVGVVVNENGTMKVKNLKVITYDRVYYPSHSNAYVEKIVANESGNVVQEMTLEPSYENNLSTSKKEELKYIKESGNSIFCPDISYKVMENNASLVNYVREQSDIVKILEDQYGLGNSNIQVQPNGKCIMENAIGDKFIVNLEDAVTRSLIEDIDKFY